jgi:hypothetical protein
VYSSTGVVRWDLVDHYFSLCSLKVLEKLSSVEGSNLVFMRQLL